MTKTLNRKPVIKGFVLRKARKEYQCCEQSYHKIKPGDLHLHAVCPPWSDGARSNKWESSRHCLACAKYYGLLTLEQKKILESTP